MARKSARVCVCAFDNITKLSIRSIGTNRTHSKTQEKSREKLESSLFDLGHFLYEVCQVDSIVCIGIEEELDSAVFFHFNFDKIV